MTEQMTAFTPLDSRAPEWDRFEKVHCWRNYVADELREMWGTFTPEQQDVLARTFDSIAEREEWE